MLHWAWMNFEPPSNTNEQEVGVKQTLGYDTLFKAYISSRL